MNSPLLNGDVGPPTLAMVRPRTYGCDVGQRLTLEQVRAAIVTSWSIETCDPVDVPDWADSNPARGQCGVTALVVNDIFGGELLISEVHLTDGYRQGFHYWNRLPSGEEVDLTREQFSSDEIVQAPQTVNRPTGPPRRCAEQYNLLRHRVFEALGSRCK